MLSIIIPVYNRQEYIEICIHSVLAQASISIPFEVIVIDDGSTDETARILSKFKNKIVYKRIQNSGRPAVPRNIGIRIAKGEYIAFQDSDDIWLPNKLADQLPALIRSKAILSYTNANIIDKSGNLTGKTVITNDQACSGKVFDKLLYNNFISTLTVIARKQSLLDCGGFDESPIDRLWEDYDLWLKMSLRGEFLYIPKVLADYRQHDENISSTSQHSDIVKKLYSLKNIRSNAEGADRRVLEDRITDLYGELAKIEKFPMSMYWKIRKKIL